MSKEEIAAVFSEKLGVDAPPDPRRLTDIARSHLRGEFLRAEMGITGANFVVAETGTVIVVTNEGNGRLCTTLPDIHIAVAGIDKVIPDWDTLAILLRLLARSATGQRMACHTSFITGPRRAEGENGPREFHLVLLDNGRTRIQQDPKARETLLCIRCAACLNVCPVYNQVGGHAYGWIYSGGIGAILSPQLLGLRLARDLPFASTLCGACADVCPVQVPISEILLYLRRRVMEGDMTEGPSAPPAIRLVGRMAAWALDAPWRYILGARMIRIAQMPFRRKSWLPALPPPLDRWTQTRPLPVFRSGFRGWWRARKRDESKGVPPRVDDASGDKNGGHFSASCRNLGSSNNSGVDRQETPSTSIAEMEKLLGEINRLSGHARRVSNRELDIVLKELVESEGIRRAALWATDGLLQLELAQRLQKLGVAIVPRGADKTVLAQTDLGITEVDFALPESGSLGLVSSAFKPRAISILPRVHLAILRPRALRTELSQILKEAKKESYLVLVTGLSRTSDIESNPVLGVHGPQALHVWAME
jgi:L-lactate utilization protein LutB